MHIDELAGSARDILWRQLVDPYVERCVDREHGGFLVDLDERWRPSGSQEKSLEHAARTTLSFALLHRARPTRGLDDLVRHGVAFLQGAFWDPQNGGFYARVDRAGRPLWSGLKHPHAVTYGVRAFLHAEPCLPPGEGHEWAGRALEWLETHAWDEEHGGYWGAYSASNERYREGERIPTPDGRDPLGHNAGLKEVNTQSDALTMLRDAVPRGLGGPRTKARLEALTALVRDRLIDGAGVLPYLYRCDWRPLPALAEVGISFQMARQLYLVGPLVGEQDVSERRARALVDFCLGAAKLPRGGFCFALSGDGRNWMTAGAMADKARWWVQLEALRMLHLLASRTGESRYAVERDAVWRFIVERLLDSRHGGFHEEPSDVRFAWRRRAPRPKTHAWKDISHEVGALLELTDGEAATALGP